MRHGLPGRACGRNATSSPDPRSVHEHADQALAGDGARRPRRDHRRECRQSVRRAQHPPAAGTALRPDQGRRLPAGLRSGDGGPCAGSSGDCGQQGRADVRQHDRRAGAFGPDAGTRQPRVLRGGAGQHQRHARQGAGGGDPQAVGAQRRHPAEREALCADQGVARQPGAEAGRRAAPGARSLLQPVRPQRRAAVARRPDQIARDQHRTRQPPDRLPAEAGRRDQGRCARGR